MSESILKEWELYTRATNNMRYKVMERITAEKDGYQLRETLALNAAHNPAAPRPARTPSSR